MMNKVEALLDIFNIQQIDELSYEASSLFIGSPNIYGGQVLAQSILAADRSVKNKKINSLHGYFLEFGNNDLPIRYEVTPIRNGYSVDVRRVMAWQGDKNIFIMAASYHKEEHSITHQDQMPVVPDPETLPPFSDLFIDFAEKFNIKPKGFYSDESPILFHPVEEYNPFDPGTRPAKSHLWFKANGEVSNYEKLESAFLAYASDFTLLITALLPHGLSFFNTPMKIASMDHSMWFHRPYNPNEWHLYVVESSSSHAGRGFCTGKIFNQSGELIANVAQEGLIRIYDQKS